MRLEPWPVKSQLKKRRVAWSGPEFAMQLSLSLLFPHSGAVLYQSRKFALRCAERAKRGSPPKYSNEAAGRDAEFSILFFQQTMAARRGIF